MSTLPHPSRGVTMRKRGGSRSESRTGGFLPLPLTAFSYLQGNVLRNADVATKRKKRFRQQKGERERSYESWPIIWKSCMWRPAATGSSEFATSCVTALLLRLRRVNEAAEKHISAPSCPVPRTSTAVERTQNTVAIAAALQHLHAFRLRHADAFSGVPLIRVGAKKAGIDAKFLAGSQSLANVIFVDGVERAEIRRDSERLGSGAGMMRSRFGCVSFIAFTARCHRALLSSFAYGRLACLEFNTESAAAKNIGATMRLDARHDSISNCCAAAHETKQFVISNCDSIGWQLDLERGLHPLAKRGSRGGGRQVANEDGDVGAGGGGYR